MHSIVSALFSNYTYINTVMQRLLFKTISYFFVSYSAFFVITGTMRNQRQGSGGYWRWVSAYHDPR